VIEPAAHQRDEQQRGGGDRQHLRSALRTDHAADHRRDQGEQQAGQQADRVEDGGEELPSGDAE